MRQKRLTRKEKIALSEANKVIKDEITPITEQITPIDPETLYITDKDIKKKIVIYSEEDACDDNFRPPCKFYFIYCTGHYIYIKTRNRQEAQRICDLISGKKDFYTVKIVVKAIAR